MEKGVVKFFNEAKGFGFITGEDGKDVFVHANDLNGAKIKDGDNVQFNVTEGKKGPNAVNVEKI